VGILYIEATGDGNLGWVGWPERVNGLSKEGSLRTRLFKIKLSSIQFRLFLILWVGQIVANQMTLSNFPKSTTT